MRIEQLCKSFGEKVVLKDFSAEIKSGGITCIMGPSGEGKTTLIRILMGLDRADSGSFSGIAPPYGVVFQEDRLCEAASAIANIRLVGASSSIKEHLAKVGLMGEDITKPVKELSGGMRRRVALVRAVMSKCDTLFLDEPFKGLDEALRGEVLEYLAENISGRTTVIVTHDLRDAKELNADIISLAKST